MLEVDALSAQQLTRFHQQANAEADRARKDGNYTLAYQFSSIALTLILQLAEKRTGYVQ